MEEKEFLEKLEKRCRTLEKEGYSFLRNTPNEVNLYGSIGYEVDNLIGTEMKRNEYVIVPVNINGSSHRIYVKEI